MLERGISFFKLNLEDKIVLLIVFVVVIVTWGFVVQRIPAVITLLHYYETYGKF